MPFVKGQSGNPSGRSRQSRKQQADIGQQCRKHTRTIVQRLVRVIKEGTDQSAVPAARELLDRGYGRPLQSAEISGPGGGGIVLSVSWEQPPQAQPPAAT
jgi:hypothetical protein